MLEGVQKCECNACDILNISLSITRLSKERQTIKYHLVEFYYSIKCSYKYMKYITSGFISKTSLFRSKPDRKLLISDKSGLCGPNFYHKCYFSWWNEMISTRKWPLMETGCTGKGHTITWSEFSRGLWHYRLRVGATIEFSETFFQPKSCHSNSAIEFNLDHVRSNGFQYHIDQARNCPFGLLNDRWCHVRLRHELLRNH